MRLVLVVIGLSLGTSVQAEPASDSDEQLITDVKALLADEAPRPSHVDSPLPGSFGELAEPYLLQLKQCHDSQSESEESAAARKAVAAGERPLEDLPLEWSETSKKCGAAADGLLRATHATTGKLPPAFTLFGQFAAKPQSYSMIQAQLAEKIAGIEALQALRVGDQARALDICADQLALARDVSHGCLIGHMVAVAMVGIATPTCQVVLAKARPPGRERFQQQLGTIQQGWTAMSVVYDDERLFGQIGPFYDTLSSETRAALPPEALLHLWPSPERGFVGTIRWSLFGAGARRESSALMRRMEEASALPPAESDAKIIALTGDTPLLVTLAYDNEAASGSSWVKFLQRARVAQARLVLLSATASVRNFHDEHGAWPRAWTDLGVEAPADPRTGKPLALEPSLEGVDLVPAPDGDRTADDLRTAVR